ncbi:MAG TPA: hypothetical protein VK202_06185, partial [Bacteroidia bacterium]|nr:hypothetical protein [Bacteroidia bacterium]
KKRIVDLLITSYDYVEQNFSNIYNSDRNFIISNRGTFAFISVIGSLNKFETQRNNLELKTTNSERFKIIEKYLKSLFEGLSALSKDEEEKQFKLLGAGADTKWLRFFQTIINTKYPEFNPPELIDWKERQNEQYQNEGRNHIKLVEKHMKHIILNNLRTLFGNNWELEINKIKTACQARANEENEKNYKDNIDKRVEWTEMFSINDYKEIIERYWSKTPEKNIDGFVTFEKTFSIEIGEGRNKKDLLKWLSFFNSYRNQLAHEGSKDKGINKEEAKFLEKVYRHFFK